MHPVSCCKRETEEEISLSERLSTVHEYDEYPIVDLEDGIVHDKEI